MSNEVPILFVDHWDKHSHRKTLRVLGSERIIMLDHRQVYEAISRNLLPVHLTFPIGSSHELGVLRSIKDTEFGGVFLHLDYDPEVRVVWDGVGSPGMLSDQASMHYIPEIVKIAKESKWSFLVITGATDDAVRDYADSCYRVTEIADFSERYKIVLDVKCYRKRATIK